MLRALRRLAFVEPLTAGTIGGGEVEANEVTFDESNSRARKADQEKRPMRQPEKKKEWTLLCCGAALPVLASGAMAVWQIPQAAQAAAVGTSRFTGAGAGAGAR